MYLWYVLYVFVFVTEYNEEPVAQLGVGCGIVECHLVANDDRDLISISVEPAWDKQASTHATLHIETDKQASGFTNKQIHRDIEYSWSNVTILLAQL